MAFRASAPLLMRATPTLAFRATAPALRPPPAPGAAMRNTLYNYTMRRTSTMVGVIMVAAIAGDIAVDGIFNTLWDFSNGSKHYVVNVISDDDDDE